MTSASEQLAAVATGLQFSALPAAVVAKAKAHVLDFAGVALASASMEFGRATVEAGYRLGGTGSCTVIGSGAGLPGVWAAMVNGMLGHGLDYDDTHLESVVHVSTGIVPAALAAAEEAEADGQRLLTAVAAGMETSVRIGLAAQGAFHDRGFHPTGICNAFGATVAAGLIARLSQAELVNALGIAGSQASGLFEFLSDGATTKRLHPGWAAHAGLVAVALAPGAISGPREVLEGRFGLFRSHLGEQGWDVRRVTEGLGARWECLDIALKPYPCCHFTHAFIDAAAVLRQQHDLRPEHIAAVDCFLSERVMPVICEPVAAKLEPQNGYAAKFSLPYTVASMLVRGHIDLDDFEEEALRDATVRALMPKVRHLPDPASEYPRRFGGVLRLRLTDGRVLEHAERINRGGSERPLTRDEVRDKCVRNASRVLSTDDVAALVEAVDRLETLPTLAPLSAALRGTARNHR